MTSILSFLRLALPALLLFATADYRVFGAIEAFLKKCSPPQ